MEIRMRARAKINWALNVVGLREDGYHELDMLMQTITLSDELTFQEAKGISLLVNGRGAPGNEKNLVLRAARTLNEHAGGGYGVKIALAKRIPARAGLGGGSADCAATLLALNELWGLNLNADVLSGIGLSLGADVPFCLAGGLARVGGVGEVVRSLRPGPPVYLVFFRVGNGLSTRDVFAQFDGVRREAMATDMEALHKALLTRDFAAVKRISKNALMEPASELMPEIPEAQKKLYACGAHFAQMSGSGSAVYGVFLDEASARAARSKLGGRVFLART